MKKLKLRKEVKFITASIALGLTLCAVPTMKVIAEDDSVDTSDLYTRLMAAETLEEFEEIAYSATEEEIALLTEEQNISIQEQYDKLFDVIYSEISEVINQRLETNEYEANPSEVVYVTVDFVNVAPLVNDNGRE